MKLSLDTSGLIEVRADALILGRHSDDAKLTPALAAVDGKLGGLLAKVMAAEKFDGKVGQVSHVHADDRLRAARVLVAGLGPKKDSGAEAVRRAASAAARRARDLGARSAAAYLAADGVSARTRAQATAEGVVLGTYRFDKYLKEKSPKSLDSLAVSEPDRRSQAAAEAGVRAGETWAAATCLARDLVNEPANVVTPAYLARRAQEIARAGRLGLKVLERADCARLGMGAYVGVAQGSHELPKFIHLTYKPKGRARKRVVVIGKGITFDSGGLDLKPADGMYRMKDDMSGAAAVLGLFQALPKLALPVEVHGLIAATENMPSGTAQRPGDVVRAMNGLTIEIGNTDAEGRLTLADALAYAAKEIKPDEMLDLATLTGAVVIALGMGLSGVFATDEGLAGRVLGAAEAAGEQMWRLPLHEEYKQLTKGDVADLTNASSKRKAGTIYAGSFLEEFVEGKPWVHLDIAGTAWDVGREYVGKGPTGYGVRLLVDLARSLAAAK